jgi:hypothetical protein
VSLILSDRPWRKAGVNESSGPATRALGGRSLRPQTTRGDITEVPNYLRLARIRGVVEVVPGPDGKPPADVLWQAYCASRSGVIVLALNGVTAAAVDRVMDGIVPHFPLNIPGVLYLDAENKPLLSWVLNNTDMVFGQTDQFRTMAPQFAAVFGPVPAEQLRPRYSNARLG